MENNNAVNFNFYQNRAIFLDSEKQIHLYVDGNNEYAFMDDVFKKIGEKIEELSQEEIDTAKDYNYTVRARFAEKYKIDFQSLDVNIYAYHQEHPDLPVLPVNNITSDADIEIQDGEGILDFIYADFQTPINKLIETHKAEKRKNKKSSAQKIETKKVQDDLHARVEEYKKYKSTIGAIKDIAYASLYSAICPPVFESGEDKLQQINLYGDYLLKLQKEYLEMIEFCFDEEFYPDLLSDKQPSKRFYIYRKLKGLPITSLRSEEILFSVVGNVEDLPENPTQEEADELLDKLTARPEPTDVHKALAKQIGGDATFLATMLEWPCCLSRYYNFSSVADILELEFTKMLEHNVRFRKCKRCGKYFIMKGNYDTNYCDRIAEGETRNCQDLAAQENYKKKMADNAAIPMYQKYYKRYSARVRVKQIKEDAFKKWKYQAITKRDECTDGIITLAEFEQWLENSFPNRKKKD